MSKGLCLIVSSSEMTIDIDCFENVSCWGSTHDINFAAETLAFRRSRLDGFLLAVIASPPHAKYPSLLPLVMSWPIGTMYNCI